MDSTGHQIEVDMVAASEWSGLLDRFEDAHIYQTWNYGAIRWGEKNLSHLVLKKESEVVAMAQLRIIRPRFFKGGVAYLRWGPLCQLRGRELEPETVRRVALALHEEYVRKRRLFLRILPNAFAGSKRALLFRTAFDQFSDAEAVRMERTFLLDLTPPIEELRKRLDQKWRNQLNRAEKNNLTIIEGRGAAEFQVFLRIYQKLWNRKKFKTSVDMDEFSRVCEELPPAHKFKILIGRHQGVAVSSLICSALGDTGIYLLGATEGEGLNTKAAYLLQWTMIKWLKESGFRYYDLGGIDPELNPGVYHFKRGLSGQDVSRIAPLEACEALVSSLFMKAADVARGGLLRGAVNKLRWKILASFSRAGRAATAP